MRESAPNPQGHAVEESVTHDPVLSPGSPAWMRCKAAVPAVHKRWSASGTRGLHPRALRVGEHERPTTQQIAAQIPGLILGALLAAHSHGEIVRDQSRELDKGSARAPVQLVEFDLGSLGQMVVERNDLHRAATH